jgi:hypothetical protein
VETDSAEALMAETDIEIELNTGGAAATDLDLTALREDIQAELNKLAAQLGESAPEPKRVPPPKGAQGMDMVLHWLMHVATEPAMAKTYARLLIFALNEIAAAARKETQPSQRANDESFVIRVKALGKDIALPTAAAAIQAALEDVTGP